MSDLYDSLAYVAGSKNPKGLAHKFIADEVSPIEVTFSQIHICQMDLSNKIEGQSEDEFSNGVKGVIGHIGYDHAMLICSRQIDAVVAGLPERDHLQIGC